jgi:DNA-binding transcriptional ArsR family regulator
MKHPLASADDSSEPSDRTAAAILAYLLDHPFAMDTAQGITEWWVLRQQIRVEVAAVMTALEKLTEQGTLEVLGEGEDKYYRLRFTPEQ